MAQWSIALLLALSQAFHAASIDEPAAQENAREHPLAAQVRQILSREHQSYIRDAVSELTRLGPEALPAILEELPRLRGRQLDAAAIVLGRAEYKPAAHALSQHVRVPLNPVILRVLGWLGAAVEVAPLAELANDPGRNGMLRLHAFALLASIGTPEAVAAIETIVGSPSREWRVSFVPPEPPTDAPVARVPLAEGRALVVFQSLKLGRVSDLWAAELNAAGAVAVPARFLGGSVPGCSWSCAISARLDGSKLTVFSDVASHRTFSVDLEVASRDSDADGLPDLVEIRLGTDPRRPDTDGDGIDDGHDPVPNARSRPPRGERQEIAADIFQQISLLDDETSDLEAVVGEASLRWFGRKGPTLAFSSHRAVNGYVKRSAATYLQRAWFKPVSAEKLAAFLADDPSVKPPGPDERAYVVAHDRGVPLSGSWYRVIVRRLAGRWAIRDVFAGAAS